MSLKTDIEAARLAIAKVPAEVRHVITLEQAFVAAHTFKFVLLVLLAGILFGLALGLVIALGWGFWMYVLWALVLLLAAFFIASSVLGSEPLALSQASDMPSLSVSVGLVPEAISP